MTTQGSSITVSGADQVTATSGQSSSLFPDISIAVSDDATINATLLVDAKDGTLSVANVPVGVHATLIQRSDVSTSVVTLSGTAAQVEDALSKVTLTATNDLTSTLSDEYHLFFVANQSGRDIVDGTLTILPSAVTVPAGSGTGATPAPVTAVPMLPYVQTGTSYVVGNAATGPATINVGLVASTVTSGASALDFTGGNSTLMLTGSGSTTVHSLGGNTVWIGSAAPLTYVSGGNSTLHVDSGTFTIQGGSASDNNVIVLSSTGTGHVEVDNTSPSQTVLFGGMQSLDYSGGNATIVLNGAGMTGSAVIDATGNNTVWAGTGDLTYRNNGTDNLVLGNGATTVTGGGAGSSSVISMGNGTLSYAGSAEDAIIHGGSGHSVIKGGSGSLAIDGGNTVVSLSTGDATVTGGGAGSENTVFNGSGRVTYQAGEGASVVTGGTGSDTVHGSLGGGWFGAGTGGNSFLQAAGGATFLQGAADGDILVGSLGGATWMQAGAGNETLVGGNSSGTAIMQLGSGNDQVQLMTGGSNITTGTGTATILSAGGNDVLAIGSQSGATTFSISGQEQATISGFRLGTDHLTLSGTSVSTTTLSGGSTIIGLSNGGSITLSAFGQDGTGGLFS